MKTVGTIGGVINFSNYNTISSNVRPCYVLKILLVRLRKMKAYLFLLVLLLFPVFSGNAQSTDPHEYPGNEITGIPSERIILIQDIAVNDSLLYNEYRVKMDSLVKKHGGVYQVQSGGRTFDVTSKQKIMPIAGQWMPDQFVILRWNSMEQFKNFINCDDYKSIGALLEKSATTKSIIINEYSQL